VQRDDIARLQEFIKGNVGDVVGGSPWRYGHRIASEDAHAEAAENLGCDAADLAGADDAGGFAVKVEPDEAGQGKLRSRTRLWARGIFRTRARRRAMVCSATAWGESGGHSGHGEAEFAGGGEVDLVETGAAERDVTNAEAGELGEDGAVGAVVDKDTGGNCALGDRGRVNIEPKLVKATGESDGSSGGCEVVRGRRVSCRRRRRWAWR